MKPIIKTNDHRWKITDWVIERFPEKYKEMTYLEPFFGGGSVFVQKEPSQEEVLNSPDCGLMSIWRAVRDEHQLFVSKLKRVKYSESTFKKNSNMKDDDDYLSVALKEFLLRQMSKNGMKKSYMPRSEKKTGSCWKGVVENINLANERIKSTFLMCKEIKEILKAFDSPNTFVYFDTPEINEEFMNQEKQIEAGEILKDYRGKVLVLAPNSAIYKRIYAGWNRKGLPGNPKESAWMNF